MNTRQVRDDAELLELMMQDRQSTSDLYKSTKYWSELEKTFLPELQSLGLHDFRRRHNSVLTAIGATDLEPYSTFLNTSPATAARRILQFQLKISLVLKKIRESLIHKTVDRSSTKCSDTNLALYESAKSYGEKNGAMSVSKFEASPIGNPENLFFIGDKMYTASLLNYYIQYAYCCKYMNFDSIHTVMELGSGAGKQIEVLRKLHPNLCFYIFDIPPQLYVCEQYLSELFPDSVVLYRQTRTMESIPLPEKGKIFIFGNWKLSELKNLKYDLFWNSAGFQEMEPFVVLNYLKYINQQTVKYVFLHERMNGVNKSTAKVQTGVIEQTKMEHYKKGLKDFHLEDTSSAVQVPKLTPWTSYKFSFWTRSRTTNKSDFDYSP